MVSMKFLLARRTSVFVLFALGASVCAGAVPVRVAFDWPKGTAASSRPNVHIRAVQTAGPNTGSAPVQAEVRPDGIDLNLDQGIWQVAAVAPGYWSQETEVAVSSETSASVQLAFWPSTFLHGQVVTPPGETLPRTLELQLTATPASAAETSSPQVPITELDRPSQATLHCRIQVGTWSCLGPAGLFGMRFEAAGYAPRYQWGVRLKPGESADFGKADLLRSASVFGRVIRKDGSNPAGPCRATLQPDVERHGPSDADAESDQENGSAANARFRVSINQRGYFQVVGVPPGRYVVAIGCHDSSALRELRVQADRETRLDPPLQLQELTLDVSLIPKTDPSGQPWKLAVYATAPHYLLVADGATTSIEGHWIRHGLMAGNYHIVVRSSDSTEWLQKYFDFDKSTEALTLHLGSVSVAGRVMMSSQPVRARLVFANDSGGESATLMSDQSGRFQGLLPIAHDANESTWTVEAHVTQPAVTQRLLGVSLRPVGTGKIAWLDLELPAIPVHGSVVSRDGKPQRGVQVTLEDSGGIRTTTSTDADGRFEMLDLPPGKYTAVADSRDGSSDRMPFEVTESRGGELKLVLNSFKRYSFSVVSSQGPVQDAAVQVWIKPGVTWAFVRSDENGHFEVSLPPGTMEAGLTVGAPGYAIKLVRLSIPSNDDVSHDASTITLDDSGGTLVLNFQPTPARELENADTLYLVHNGAIQDARTLAGWGTNRAATAADEPAVVDAIEPGDYALCPVTDTAQLAALWSGSLPPRCTKGSVQSGETLTLSPR